MKKIEEFLSLPWSVDLDPEEVKILNAEGTIVAVVYSLPWADEIVKVMNNKILCH